VEGAGLFLFLLSILRGWGGRGGGGLPFRGSFAGRWGVFFCEGGSLFLHSAVSFSCKLAVPPFSFSIAVWRRIPQILFLQSRRLQVFFVVEPTESAAPCGRGRGGHYGVGSSGARHIAVGSYGTSRSLLFFFRLFILVCFPSRIWQRTFYPSFPSAIRTVAARCKLPFALRPDLSQEDKIRTKELQRKIIRSKEKARPSPPPPPPPFLLLLLTVCGCHERGRGQERGSSPAPNSPASVRLSNSRSWSPRSYPLSDPTCTTARGTSVKPSIIGRNDGTHERADVPSDERCGGRRGRQGEELSDPASGAAGNGRSE